MNLLEYLGLKSKAKLTSPTKGGGGGRRFVDRKDVEGIINTTALKICHHLQKADFPHISGLPLSLTVEQLVTEVLVYGYLPLHHTPKGLHWYGRHCWQLMYDTQGHLVYALLNGKRVELKNLFVCYYGNGINTFDLENKYELKKSHIRTAKNQTHFVLSTGGNLGETRAKEIQKRWEEKRDSDTPPIVEGGLEPKSLGLPAGINRSIDVALQAYTHEILLTMGLTDLQPAETFRWAEGFLYAFNRALIEVGIDQKVAIPHREQLSENERQAFVNILRDKSPEEVQEVFDTYIRNRI